ncbi:MAG: D-glycero-beta-D-manno-heptose 1,7-bisphosphate 7-phosphatase [Candidatus Woesearchaeota archaeon]|nr:D-glycero-beta-D-manno-heptose 1,7-bisphosphate 7-phosphatase [Candidatus Woesearchaeota archaeon]
MNKAIFLDRDGVINIDKNYVHKISQFEFVPNTFEALRNLREMGFKLIVITNQSGIGRGYYSKKEYYALRRHINKKLKEENITIDAEYFCPHSPEDNCRCRKPNPYFIDMAVKRFRLDREECFFVGDKTADILSADKGKIKSVLVRTGKGGNDRKYNIKPDLIFDDLHSFSKHLKENWKPKVLYLGNFNWENHLRGRNLFRGLIENGIEVKLILGKGLKYFLMLIHLMKRDFDVILTTGKPCALLAILTKHWHKRKIIFDVYISDYENLVLNRRLVKDGSLKAKLLKFLDRYTCEKSNAVFLDTIKHAQWYYTYFDLDKEKFSHVLIGSDDERFHEMKIKRGKMFNVLFFGSFAKGHGIDVILKAAKIVEKENIMFTFAGKGIVFDEMVELSKTLKCKNVEFLGWVEQKNLPKIIAASDVCLGIFNAEEIKVRRSIPTKLFECAPMKKVFITGNTPAMEGITIHRENGMLSKLGDEKDLAKCILEIYSDKKLKKKIEENAFKLYKEKFTTKMIGKQLLDIIRK